MKNRQAYQPASYTLRIFKEAIGLEIFIYTSKSNRPCAIGWNSKRQVKPAFHFNFRSEADREAYVTKFVKEATEAAARKQETQAHNMVVGDILSSRWGYDQTNVEFYEVVATSDKFVSVRRLQASAVATGDMTAKELPVLGQYKNDKVIRRKVINGYVYITDYNLASKWDKRPEHSSS